MDAASSLSGTARVRLGSESMTPEPDEDLSQREYQQKMLSFTQRVEGVLAGTSDRRLNNVWEYTQSLVAVLVVGTTCGGIIALARDNTTHMPPEWWTIVGLVIGFYFGRNRTVTRTGFEHERKTDRSVSRDRRMDEGSS